MMRLASLKLFASSFLPFLVAAYALQLPLSSIALGQAKTLSAGDGSESQTKHAGPRSDFGIRALRRAKEHFAADDFTAARRSLSEAAGMLVDMAESIEPPIRADVWILVNDLRLLRIPEGGAKLVTLHGLNDAEARASAVAARHAEWVGSRATHK